MGPTSLKPAWLLCRHFFQESLTWALRKVKAIPVLRAASLLCEWSSTQRPSSLQVTITTALGRPTTSFSLRPNFTSVASVFGVPLGRPSVPKGFLMIVF